MKISIIDYDIGNIGSVGKAVKYIGGDVEWIRTPEKILSADKIILPGVSAFGAAMDNLKKLNMIEPLREKIKSGAPFLGICVGIQLLFEGSEESAGSSGLNCSAYGLE